MSSLVVKCTLGGKRHSSTLSEQQQELHAPHRPSQPAGLSVDTSAHMTVQGIQNPIVGGATAQLPTSPDVPKGRE